MILINVSMKKKWLLRRRRIKKIKKDKKILNKKFKNKKYIEFLNKYK